MGPRGKRSSWMVGAALGIASLLAGCLPSTPPNATTGASPVAAAGPTSGGRDLTNWPFASTSPWNTPLGNGATFDARSIVTLANSVPWINSYEYSVPVVRASASDPVVTLEVSGGTFPGTVTLRIPAGAQPAAGGDRHLAIISPDGTQSAEFWALDLTAKTAGTYLPVALSGSGVGIGWARATGVSLLGGLIRSNETTAIQHALAMSLPYNLLGNGHVWPAISDDDSGAPGTVPQGSLLAIPPGTPRPAGLSPLGSAIFDALSRYGAYVVDQSGGGAAVLYAEPSTSNDAVNRAIPDINVIMPLLRRMTNNGPSSVGGTGARLAPTAP